MHRYRGMSTRLPQKIPVFGQINFHLGFCPEDFFDAAHSADQRNITRVNVWINTTATPDTSNIPGNKTAFGNAFPDEPQPLGIS
jgi:hypothetical protein